MQNVIEHLNKCRVASRGLYLLCLVFNIYLTENAITKNVKSNQIVSFMNDFKKFCNLKDPSASSALKES